MLVGVEPLRHIERTCALHATSHSELLRHACQVAEALGCQAQSLLHV